ncbi:MAG: rod shape-determining protein [Patescibacteria group bacterium]|nr:rod shape-determining protein [Patescibacteria group bacterium]
MIGGKIGIDLGTANCFVWVEGEGIVLEEPTVVAVTVDNNKVVAVGSEAKQMLGRTPESITASRPMKDGVIADYAVTEAMLRFFIQKVKGKSFFFKPEVMICVPAGCTQVERRAVMDAALSSGAKDVYLIDEPLAAAIGADIPIGAASGSMIVDIGGGAAEAAVVSLGSVVISHSIRMAGNKIDEAISSFVRKKHNLIIGEQTAEEVKLKLGSAIALPKSEIMEIKGRDSIMGLPKMIEITSTEVLEAIRPVLNQIVGVVKSVLEETPPELASDIIDRGIVMTGGTSLLRGLDKYMTEETGVPAHVAENALKCVINGVSIALQNLEKYKQNISKH